MVRIITGVVPTASTAVTASTAKPFPWGRVLGVVAVLLVAVAWGVWIYVAGM